MRFSLAIMYVAKVQTHVLEYPTQERFVHVSFHGSRDDDWLIGHDLVSEERKLLCLRRTCQGKEGIRERYAALHKRPSLIHALGRLNACTLGVRLEQ